MLVRPVMKRLFFPWKTKGKKARFARALHYETKTTSAVRLRISSRLICASCVRYFDRAYYHYNVPSCRHFDRYFVVQEHLAMCFDFTANRLLNTRTLLCRAYTIPTHSFGVRVNNPRVFYAADCCTYKPWTIPYLLILTIGLSIC